MLNNCKTLSKIISEQKKDLADMRSSIGKLIMYNIIYNATNKRPSVNTFISQYTAKTSKYANTPLMELTVGGKQYVMVFDRLDKHVTGEYETYEDISRKKEGLPDDFEEQLEYFESILIDNAVNVFASLPQDIKKSNPGFAMIIRGKRKRYIYYYSDHQKVSFGLIFLESAY